MAGFATFSLFSSLVSLLFRNFAAQNAFMNTLSNVETRGVEAITPGLRPAPDAIPDAENTQNGVSVEYVHDPTKRWYVFRASYGREDKASDVMIADGTFTYIAKRDAIRFVNGKRKRVTESLIPNLLFAYVTPEKAEEYVKQTPELAYLTYYYNHFQLNEEQKNPPLTVSVKEMDNFMLATVSHNEHLLFVDPEKCHYKSGDMVVVTDGLFKGVEGKVARVAGQQRVIVTLSKIGLISTAYIPTAFIEKI